jgi:zinc transporter ZupT
MIALHVAAVAWYAWVRRTPLVRAMLTGRKAAHRVPEGEAIGSSRTVLALAIAVVLAVVLALAIRAAPEAPIALF